MGGPGARPDPRGATLGEQRWRDHRGVVTEIERRAVAHACVFGCISLKAKQVTAVPNPSPSKTRPCGKKPRCIFWRCSIALQPRVASHPSDEPSELEQRFDLHPRQFGVVLLSLSGAPRCPAR